MRKWFWRALYRVLAVFTVVTLMGCATVRGDAVVTLNAASDLAALVEPKLEQLDHQEQEACLPRLDKVACVAAVRARYAGTWSAYRKFLAAWLASAATVRSYDALVAAGKAPSTQTILATVATLADAEQAFAAAAAQLGVVS